MADPNIPHITDNANRVNDFIGILNLLRSGTEYIDTVFMKTKDDYIYAKYIVNRLKEHNHTVLGVLPLTDFFSVFA